MPELSDGDDDDDDDVDADEEQWMEEESQTVICLFCDKWDTHLFTV